MIESRSARGARTQDRILDEAFVLFAGRGYHAVSVRDIAASVGIKDASLYNHFESKHAIFEAILERELNHLRDVFAPHGVMYAVDDDPSGYDPTDPNGMRERVLHSFQFFFEDPSLRLLRRLLVVNQYEDETVARAYHLVFIERPQALQQAVFEHCMAAGLFERADVAQMSLEFYGPVFLMLHANTSWDEAKPRIISLLDSFTQRYRLDVEQGTCGL